MNFVFVPRNSYSVFIKYLAEEYFKLEQEGIGAQVMIACRDFQDVIKYIERDPGLDSTDNIDILGIVPAGSDLEVLRSLAEPANINVILGENQVTPEIERDEALVDVLPVPLLERALIFYMSNEVPDIIRKLDLALAGNNSDVIQDAVAKLCTLKNDAAFDVIDRAIETNGASLVEFVKGNA